MSGGKQKKGGEKKNGAGKNKEPETAGWHQDYREAGNRNMQSLGYDLIVDDVYLWNMDDHVGLIMPEEKMKFQLKK